MATDLHNPISKAVQLEDMAKTLSKYHKSWGGGKKEYAGTVTAFYDLVTESLRVWMGAVFSLRTDEGGGVFRGIHCQL